MVSVEWVYDENNKTPEGTYDWLLFLLGQANSYPSFRRGYKLLYFQAANTKSPEKGKCWCQDCNNNAEALEQVILNWDTEIELWRVVASWRRRDWVDKNGRPVLQNPFRDVAKLWRIPGLPHAQLVEYDETTGPVTVQKTDNPNREGLQYLLSRSKFMKFNL
jgi:hypothetical protein